MGEMAYKLQENSQSRLNRVPGKRMQDLQGDNSTGVRTAGSQSTPRESAGFTVLELIIVVAVLLVIAAIAVPNMLQAVYSARCARAVGDIRTIGDSLITYQVSNAAPANTLSDVGYSDQMDPWGHPYQYLNLFGVEPTPPLARVDDLLVPVNMNFDLYSMGEDGLSAPSITDPTSQDDIIWTGDGSNIGMASNY